MSEPSEAKEKVRKILEQDEYQAYDNQGQSMVQHLQETLGNWLKELITSFFPNAEVPDNTMAGLVYFFGIVGVALLIFLGFKLIRNLTSQKELQRRRAYEQQSELEWSVDRHMKEAERTKRTGEYSIAARHLFLAMLLSFDEQQWVEAKEWKTNWDYYDELKRVNPELARNFQQLALTFEQVTYGSRRMNEQELEDFEAQVLVWMSPSPLSEREGSS